MPKNRVYISLTEASEVHRRHPHEVQPPHVVKAENLYLSPGDHALTLRPDVTPSQAMHIYSSDGNAETCGVFYHPIGFPVMVQAEESQPVHMEQYGRMAIFNATDGAGKIHGPYITRADNEPEEQQSWPPGEWRQIVSPRDPAADTQPQGYTTLVFHNAHANRWVLASGFKLFTGASLSSVSLVTQSNLDSIFRAGASGPADQSLFVTSSKIYSTEDYTNFALQVQNSYQFADIAYSPIAQIYCAVGTGIVSGTPTSGYTHVDIPVERLEAIIFSSILGKFIAVGANGTIATSADGITWDYTSLGTTSLLLTIVELPGTCLLIGAGDGVYRSEDGVDWTKTAAFPALKIIRTATEFIVRSGDYLRASADGITWTNDQAVPFYTAPLNLWFVNGSMFCSVQKNQTYYLLSGDIVPNLAPVFPVWTVPDSLPVAMARVGNILFYGGHDGWLITYNLVTKQRITRHSGVLSTLRGATVSGSGAVFFCGDNGTVIRSTDSGATWHRLNTGTSQDLYNILWANDGSGPHGRLYVIGAYGVARYSIDNGNTWASATGLPSYQLMEITYCKGTWVIAIFSSIYYSTNGTSFSRVSAPSYVWQIRATKSRFIVLSNYGALFSASNINGPWKQHQSVTNIMFSMRAFETFGEYVYIIGNLNGQSGTSVVRLNAASDEVQVLFSTPWFWLGHNNQRFLIYQDIIYYRLLASGQAQVIEVGSGFLPKTAGLLSDTFQAAAFASVDGQVLLLNCIEDNVRYPRRIRWSAPGTPDVFDPSDTDHPGAGYDDYIGTGQFVDARALGHNVIIFETAAVSVFSQTGFIEAPWEFRRIAENIEIASNPCIVNDSAYFVAKDGHLYSANSVSVQPLDSPFDLTKYADFGAPGRVWLAYEPRMNALCVYVPSDDARLYVISLATGAVTTWSLPRLPESDGEPAYPLGISGLPGGVAASTLFLHFKNHHLAHLAFDAATTGIDRPRKAIGSEPAPPQRHWVATIELGELQIAGGRSLLRILSIAPRLQVTGDIAPRLLSYMRDGAHGTWQHMGDRNGNAIFGGSFVDGTNTAWSWKVADGDDITVEFDVPYWVGHARLMRDDTPLYAPEHYSPVDTGHGFIYTKRIRLTDPLPAGSTLYQYWSDSPTPTVKQGDVFESPSGEYYTVTSVDNFARCSIDREAPIGTPAKHHYTAQVPFGETETPMRCNGLANAPQFRIVLLPGSTTLAKVLGLALDYVVAGERMAS